ncbi:glycosyltransferase [Larkinella harenae]
MDNSLVSIIIPAFNRETLIAETLESVLYQTYPYWECIVIDDHSNDNTVEVVKAYCKQDHRFKLISRDRDPKGAQTCRNIGIQQSKGVFLLFLDSDDLLFRNAIQDRVSFLKENTNLDFCVSQGVLGQYPLSNDNKYYYTTDLLQTDYIFKFCRFLASWITLNAMWKKESIVKNEMYWNEKLPALQDIDFHLKAVLKCFNFEFVSNTPDCFYRNHSLIRISVNAKRENASLVILNESVLPLVSKKNRNDVLPLLSYIINTHYLLQNPMCGISEFVYFKLVGVQGFIRLWLTLPILRRLLYMRIKGRSYLLRWLNDLSGINRYLTIDDNVKNFSNEISNDVLLYSKEALGLTRKIDV